MEQQSPSLPAFGLPVNDKGIVQLDGAKFLTAVSGLRQFTIFGTNHTVKELEVFAGKELLEGFQSKGVKKLYLELPPGHQHVVKAYNHGGVVAVAPDGSKTPVDEDYVEGYFKNMFEGSAFKENLDRAAKAMSDTLMHSKNNDIEIEFYAEPPQAIEKYPEMAQIHAEVLSLIDTQGHGAARKYLDQLPEDIVPQYKQYLAEFNMNSRMANFNAAQAISLDAGEDMAVICIGGWHLENDGNKLSEKDVDELLGEHNVVSVQFFTSIDDPHYKKLYDENLDMPNFFYFVDEGKGVVPPKEYDPEILSNASPIAPQDDLVSAPAKMM